MGSSTHSGSSRRPVDFYRKARAVGLRTPLVNRVVPAIDDVVLTLRDGSVQDAAIFERLFRGRDPYGFRREVEQKRFARAEQILERLYGEQRIGRMLEVGCAEGNFTRRIASRCEHLDATDVSPTAVARAKESCMGLEHVVIQVANLRDDPFPCPPYGVILVIGVLEYIRRPNAIRVILDKLVDGITPQGYLLIGTTLLGTGRSLWSRVMLRDGWINQEATKHPSLEVLSIVQDQFACPFEHILLRKRSC
jgi:cyclopropane fatty-acyl-phospholipid synthase-like methyltransferase